MKQKIQPDLFDKAINNTLNRIKIIDRLKNRVDDADTMVKWLDMFLDKAEDLDEKYHRMDTDEAEKTRLYNTLLGVYRNNVINVMNWYDYSKIRNAGVKIPELFTPEEKEMFTNSYKSELNRLDMKGINRNVHKNLEGISNNIKKL